MLINKNKQIQNATPKCSTPIYHVFFFNSDDLVRVAGAVPRTISKRTIADVKNEGSSANAARSTKRRCARQDQDGTPEIQGLNATDAFSNGGNVPFPAEEEDTFKNRSELLEILRNVSKHFN